MVPRAVLMNSGLVSVNNPRQVIVAHSKTTMNAARPMTYLSKIAHLTVKRPIQKNIAFKNSNINQKVNTGRSKNVNTVRPKAVVNNIKGNHDQRVIDSGCSRHMTWNMSYLTNYEEIDGGYVAFRGNPKGGKTTGKCTIKTDDMEEMDLRWQMAMLTMRPEGSVKLCLCGYDWSDKAEEGPNYALMAYTSSSSDSKNENLLKDLEKSKLMVIDEFANKPVVKNYEANSSEKEPKVVRKNNDALIIEECVSDNEEDEMT
nr:ribonuclease H-like domain-containing protein [Tanacetum cinerariifolium]